MTITIAMELNIQNSYEMLEKLLLVTLAEFSVCEFGGHSI